jgi:hypothetical protein
MELLGNRSASFRGAINHDWDEKRFLLGHVTDAFDGQPPLATEVPLVPGFGVGGDQRKKQPAVVDLLPDLVIPGLTASQLTLVEPDLHACGAQGLANAVGSLLVL